MEKMLTMVKRMLTIIKKKALTIVSQIFSPMRARETKVMATFIAPIPKVADWLWVGSAAV